MQMPAQQNVDRFFQRRLDVPSLRGAQPFERMMNQRDVQFGIQFLEIGDCRVQTPASNPELLVILVVLAEQSAVDEKDAQLAPVHFDHGRQSTSSVFRERSNAVEIAVVPIEKRSHFERQMRLWPIRIEVLVRLLARLECSCQPNAKIPIYIMIAGYDEQAALRQIDSGQQLVEEFSRDFVFLSFTGMCDIAGGKNQIGRASPLPIFGNRFHQRPQNHIAVIWVPAANVKIRNMQPRYAHKC